MWLVSITLDYKVKYNNTFGTDNTYNSNIAS